MAIVHPADYSFQAELLKLQYFVKNGQAAITTNMSGTQLASNYGGFKLRNYGDSLLNPQFRLWSAPSGQQVEAAFIVPILEEGALASVAALDDVVRNARQDKAGKARHQS